MQPNQPDFQQSGQGIPNWPIALKAVYCDVINWLQSCPIDGCSSVNELSIANLCQRTILEQKYIVKLLSQSMYSFSTIPQNLWKQVCPLFHFWPFSSSLKLTKLSSMYKNGVPLSLGNSNFIIRELKQSTKYN